ncbi:MAG TPA: 4Fe-4S dicluster domain-containing protein [Thermoleophilia bacterium]|nr:4Fe-4S dicluster domain-containing protein [Thermoleophilia bacterium]
MVDRVITKSALAESLEQLATTLHVAAPVEESGRVMFRRVHYAAELADHYLPTMLPPTKYARPPDEELLRFSWAEGPRVEPVFEAEEIVIFGVRPCDMHAFDLLDQIFSEENSDGHYQARREALTLIGMECLEPCDEHSFCRSMGSLEATGGFDLLLSEMGDGYYVRVGTAKGRALIGTFQDAREAVYEDRKRLRKTYLRRESQFEHRLEDMYDELPRVLADSEDSLLWDVLGEKCLSCGACTNVCPTCFCFDVHDDVNLDLQSGRRRRHWDSCQLEEFAMVGTGESFRQPRNLRVKHRFNHKGRYLMERYGVPGCVGCGRCARDCLVGISPIEVFNQLKGQPVER